jgi:hypothetical protein
MGEKVKHLGRTPAVAAQRADAGVDPERAARVLPVLAQILGVEP